MNVKWGTLTEIRGTWEPPSLRQRLGLALFSIGLGLIAGTGGLALIVADNDSDPQRASAFALVQMPSVATLAPKTSAEAPLVDAVLAREIRDSDSISREIAKRANLKSCPGTSAYEAENRCGSSAASNPDMTAPASSPPALAVVPTSDDSHSQVIAEAHPPASVENTPVAEVNATPSADAGPAVVEAPAPEASAAKEPKTARPQSGHRPAYQQSSAWFDSRPRRGRYAQQHFWPFW